MLRPKVCASALSAALCALGMAFAACGGDSGGDDPGGAGAAGAAGAGEGGAPGGGAGGGAAGGSGAGGGGAGLGGAGGGGGSAGGGGQPPVSAGYATIDGAGYAGVDLTVATLGAAPEGCVGGFDAAKGELLLTLQPPVTAVIVGSFEGVVVANGVPCTAADGAQAAVNALRGLDVRGGAGPDTVIFDLGTGPYDGPLWSGGAGVRVGLGGGGNRFFLRGSAGADAVRLGRDDGAATFDLNGDGAGDVRVEGAGTIGLSLGPGDDDFAARGFGALAPFASALAVHGDDGADKIGGGDGNDALFGDAGDDAFAAGPAPDGADLYDGGEGSDVVDYGARTAALSFTIDDQANDGQANERDEVRPNVDAVTGGAGDDTFVGGPEDNTFDGLGGNDRLDGGGGADTLYGSEGSDRLDGGDGDNDFLYGGPGVDELDCGDGVDFYDHDAGDSVKACEI